MRNFSFSMDGTCVGKSRRRVARLIALSWILAQLSAVCVAQDILASYNGNFEAGLAQWRFFEVPTSLGSTADITTDVAQGTKAIKVTFVAPDGSLVDRAFDNWDTNVIVTPGTAYTVSVQAKSGTSGLILQISFGFFDASRGVLAEGAQSFTLTSSYQTFSLQRTAPANAAYCWIAFRLKDGAGHYAAGTLYLDDAQIVGQGVTPVQFTPRVMPLTLPAEDVPVASIDVTEAPFSAQKDGSVDATSAFQSAIDYAATAGGGVIFVPAGRYRFDGSLLIKEKVILRGDWQSPDSGGAGKGTVLMVYAGQGDEAGTPFISMNRGSGLRNLSIWYPQQVVAPKPYPWTILCNPDNADGRGDNVSVVNVTLVNPYQAIKIGPASNELHYIRNVYGAALKAGMWLSQTTDIGRIMNVHFEPKYWSSSGLTGSPSEESVRSWTANNGEGIAMGRSDWEYMYDVSLIGYKTGLRLFNYDNSGPAANGVIYALHTDLGQVGIRIECTNDFGFAITGSVINASAGSSPACVETGPLFTAVTQFNSCTFGGQPAAAVRFDEGSTGRLTFENCTFDDWGYHDAGAAVRVDNGSVAILGCEFKQDKPDVELGSGVSQAQILDNVFPASPRVLNSSMGEVLVSQEPLNLPKLSIPPHTFGLERRPVSTNLYVVTAYGAVGDKTTDNTIAFQAALDAASSAGGGTVYVPAGWFRISTHLNVPAGVELRGMWDVPHHTTSQGSVLLAYEGKGNAGGTPFITLQPGAGVRGLVIWYPDQTFVSYPWTIQAKGANCWVKDVTLSNPYQGIDFATYSCPNHFISYVGGSPLKTGIFIDNSSGDGWVENSQFNPHYWLRSGGYPGSVPGSSTLVAYQQSNLDAYKFGSCVKEHVLGNFVYAALRGLYFANTGSPCNADVFLHGTDAGSYGISVESPSGSVLTFVNSQLVLLGTARQSYIYTSSQFAGTASFFNTLEWGDQSGLSADINGTGTTVLQQINTLADRLSLRGGNTAVQAVTMQRQFAPQVSVASTITSASVFANSCPTPFSMTNQAGDKIEADYNYRALRTQVKLATGWDATDRQNDWNNTLYDAKNASPATGQTQLRCSTSLVDSGNALAVSGKNTDAGATAACFKVFKTSLPIFESTVLSYSLRPTSDEGRSVHVDLLFTDGTRLSALNPLAADSLPLNSLRGQLNQWCRVECAVGKYAVGKTVQTILVNYDRPAGAGEFSAYIDSLSIGPTGSLPAPWNELNIGTPAPGGIGIFDRASFFLEANGAGLQYGGDNFYFINQAYAGDVTVVARLDRLDPIQGSAFGGLMIRETASPLSRFFQVSLSPEFGVQSLYRLQSNSGIIATAHPSVPPTTPLWLKIVRSGSQFNTYASADSTSWGAPLYQGTVAMDSSVIVGMAISSASGAGLMNAQFSSVRVTKNDITGVRQFAGPEIPSQVMLLPNYPNPFNPSTRIQYGVPADTQVRIAVYNIMGQKVRTLVDGNEHAGYHSVEWNAMNDAGEAVSSGIYFYRLHAANRDLVGRMLLIR